MIFSIISDIILVYLYQKGFIELYFRRFSLYAALLSVLFLLPALFSGCVSFTPPESSTTASSGLTNTYGQEIPAYSDVEFSPLDAELFMKNEEGRYFYADSAVKTYTGVDVSSHQGSVDWNAVKNDGIDFTMLRVGYRGYGPEGKLGDDDTFRYNYENAKAAGLDVGVYFFSQATTPEEAREEARFVLDRIDGLDITYPVAYDWEAIDYDTARTDGMTTEQISDCAAAFCDTVAQRGYTVLVYFNRELGYFNYDLSKLQDYHFWLAEYLSAPTFVYDYKIWQYAKDGSVDGINGNVDLNISVHDFAGDR